MPWEVRAHVRLSRTCMLTWSLDSCMSPFPLFQRPASPQRSVLGCEAPCLPPDLTEREMREAHCKGSWATCLPARRCRAPRHREGEPHPVETRGSRQRMRSSRPAWRPRRHSSRGDTTLSTRSGGKQEAQQTWGACRSTRSTALLREGGASHRRPRAPTRPCTGPTAATTGTTPTLSATPTPPPSDRVARRAAHGRPTSALRPGPPCLPRRTPVAVPSPARLLGPARSSMAPLRHLMLLRRLREQA